MQERYVPALHSTPEHQFDASRTGAQMARQQNEHGYLVRALIKGSPRILNATLGRGHVRIP